MGRGTARDAGRGLGLRFGEQVEDGAGEDMRGEIVGAGEGAELASVGLRPPILSPENGLLISIKEL